MLMILTTEGQFASDFTKNYEKIGKVFPEFLRLKELCKVQLLGRLLNSYEKSMESSLEKLKDPNNVLLKEHFENVKAKAMEDLKKNFIENLSKIRREVKKQVRWISSDVISQVRSTLNSSSGCSFSDADIEEWLNHGYCSGMVNIFANHSRTDVERQIRNLQVNQIKQQEERLKAFKASIEELNQKSTDILKAVRPKGGCKWVPAVCHNEERRIMYGGVSLCPKMRDVPLTFNSWMTTTKPVSSAIISQAQKTCFTPKHFKPQMSTPYMSSSRTTGFLLRHILLFCKKEVKTMKPIIMLNSLTHKNHLFL